MELKNTDRDAFVSLSISIFTLLLEKFLTKAVIQCKQ